MCPAPRISVTPSQPFHKTFLGKLVTEGHSSPSFHCSYEMRLRSFLLKVVGYFKINACHIWTVDQQRSVTPPAVFLIKLPKAKRNEILK